MLIIPDLAYHLMQFGVEMAVQPQNRWRSFFAALCLLAVALLYAPLGGATWLLYSSACCTSGAQCPIHGHHHAPTPTSSQNAMDCGHDMSAMAQCSMSCCHDPDRPAVAPAIFVLPSPVSVSFSTVFEPFLALPSLQNCFSSFEPLSPPPRISSLAA